MSKILITYFSFSGSTKRLAEAAAEGASGAGAETLLMESATATAQDLNEVDVLLVATPQSFGTMAGETKKLFERLWMAKAQIAPGLSFAGIVVHKSAPAPTVELMDKLGGYFGFAKAHDSLTLDVARLEEASERCRELGASLARITRKPKA